MTQREKVREFIRSRGKVTTGQLNSWACENLIGCPDRRARECKDCVIIRRPTEEEKTALHLNGSWIYEWSEFKTEATGQKIFI